MNRNSTAETGRSTHHEIYLHCVARTEVYVVQCRQHVRAMHALCDCQLLWSCNMNNMEALIASAVHIQNFVRVAQVMHMTAAYDIACMIRKHDVKITSLILLYVMVCIFISFMEAPSN